MCLKFGFVIFWQKHFGAKAAHKMLVILTPGSFYSETFYWQIREAESSYKNLMKSQKHFIPARWKVSGLKTSTRNLSNLLSTFWNVPTPSGSRNCRSIHPTARISTSKTLRISARYTFVRTRLSMWRHDLQHKDTQHNDTQHNDTQHNDRIIKSA